MKNKWHKRRASRGVAMVEAGILAPIFAMMMMMNIYLGGVYEKKYLSAIKSRYYTWSYAANSGNPPSGYAGQGASATQAQSSGSNPCSGQTPSGGGSTQGMFIATGYDQETWDYSPTYKFNGGSAKTIKTTGQVLKNEPPNPGNSIISSLAGKLGSMFGAIFGGNNPCP